MSDHWENAPLDFQVDPDDLDNMATRISAFREAFSESTSQLVLDGFGAAWPGSKSASANARFVKRVPVDIKAIDKHYDTHSSTLRASATAYRNHDEAVKKSVIGFFERRIGKW